MKAKSARYGANVNRALMIRKIKAVFEKHCIAPRNSRAYFLVEMEQELLRYASGQAARSKKKKGGL